MLDKRTYPNAKVVNLAQNVIAVKLNPEISKANEKLATKYGVEGVPMIFFLDAKGNKIHEIQGYLPPDRFAAEMQKALKLAKK